MPEVPTRPDLHPLEAAEERRTVLLRLVRVIFLAMFATVALLAMLGGEDDGRVDDGGGVIPGTGLTFTAGWHVIGAVTLGLFAAVILIDVFTPHKRISTLFSVFFGLVVAMLATLGMGWIIDLLAEQYRIDASEMVATIKVLVGICLAYLCITTVLQTQDDFRLVIPYVEFAKQLRGPRPLVLDSSALIDARIVDLSETGVVQSPVVIPRFVINELQLMADAGDRLRRARGRRGLDIVAKLQRNGKLDVSIDETPVPGKAVDQMLVELARGMSGMIVTGDQGLSRVASIHGVSVLNLQDLANAMRPAVIPGEQFRLRVMKQGEQQGQGVGYLEDGTMVVVEDGSEAVGQEADVTVASTLQTSAGRLIFARIHPKGESGKGEKGESAGGEGGGARGSNGRADGGGRGAGDQDEGGSGAGEGAGGSSDGPAEGTRVGGGEPSRESRGGDQGGRGKGPAPPGRPAKGNRARNPRR